MQALHSDMECRGRTFVGADSAPVTFEVPLLLSCKLSSQLLLATPFMRHGITKALYNRKILVFDAVIVEEVERLRRPMQSMSLVHVPWPCLYVNCPTTALSLGVSPVSLIKAICKIAQRQHQVSESLACQQAI